MFRPRLVPLFLTLILLCGTAAADVPQYITYQGRLTSDTGVPLDTTVNLTFALYTDTTGITYLWEETHENVAIESGLFAVYLGSVKPFPPECFDGDLHGLTIAVGSEAPSDPIPLVSVAYAIRTAVADSAGTAAIAEGSIDSVELADGGVSMADLSRNGAGDGQVIKYSVKNSAWLPADDEEGSPGSSNGWTEDGTTVRLETTTDEVAIGATSPLGKLHVEVSNSDDPTLYLEGSSRDISWATGQALQFGEWNGTTYDEHARFTSSGSLGLGTSGPLAHLHIEGIDQGLSSGDLQFEDVVIEDQDAVISLYSNEFGSAGSALVFGEISSTTGEVTDKWGLARLTEGAGSRLRVTYGTNTHPYDNPTVMTFDPSGSVGIGDVTPDDAQLKVSTSKQNAVIGNSYIFAGDSAIGVMGIAGVSFSGNPVGVVGRATTGVGVLGVGDDDAGGHGVIGRGLTGVKGEAMEETNSIGVLGEGTNNANSIGVYGKAGDAASAGVGVKGESFVSSSPGVLGVGNGISGRGVRGEATSTNMASQGAGGYFSSEGGLGRGVVATCSGTSGYGIHATANGTNGTGIYAQGGIGGKAAKFRGNVEVLSRATGAPVLELGEGLDYAEGFDVSDHLEILPGMVLAIDVKNPGRLTLAREAYDTKVAGIVAGANGLGSGVRLGANQHDLDVALAGRVYCQTIAVDGDIQPGDLLTTSDVPGFAQKVTDYHRAQGAILGKAMQPLKQGEAGMILVLVTLQ